MFRWFHLLLFHLLWPQVWSFKICAFNAQHFGEKKAANQDVLDILIKIVQRCDICLLQEVQDPKGQALSKLMQGLNRQQELFQFVISPPLGRNSYTEKYAFIYKSDKISVRDQYKYHDNDPKKPDVFAREPYVVRFTLRYADLQDLVVIPQHTVPDKADEEIEALYDVFLNVTSHWRCNCLDKVNILENHLSLQLPFAAIIFRCFLGMSLPALHIFAHSSLQNSSSSVRLDGERL